MASLHASSRLSLGPPAGISARQPRSVSTHQNTTGARTRRAERLRYRLHAAAEAQENSSSTGGCPVLSGLKPLPDSKDRWWEQTLAMFKTPKQYQESILQGRPFAVGTFAFAPGLLLGELEVAKQVAGAEGENVESGWLPSTVELLGPNALSPEKDMNRHRSLRQMISPAVRGEEVDAALPAIQAMAKQLLDSWADQGEAGKVTVAFQGFRHFTFSVITHMCFGAALPERESARLEALFTKWGENLFIFPFLTVNAWPFPYQESMQARASIVEFITRKTLEARIQIAGAGIAEAGSPSRQSINSSSSKGSSNGAGGHAKGVDDDDDGSYQGSNGSYSNCAVAAAASDTSGKPIAIWPPPAATSVISAGDSAPVAIWPPPNGNIGALIGSETNPAAMWPPRGTPIVSGSDNEIAAIWPPRGTPVIMGSDDTHAAMWPPRGTPVINSNDTRPAAIWPPKGTPVVTGSDNAAVAVWPPRSTPVVNSSDTAPAAIWPPRSLSVTSDSDSNNTSVAVWPPKVDISGVEGSDNVIWPPKGMPVANGSDVTVWPPKVDIVAADGNDDEPAAMWPPRGTPVIGAVDVSPADLWPPKGTPIINGSDNTAVAVWPPPPVTAAVDGIDSTPAAMWPPKGMPVIDSSDNEIAAVWPPPKVAAAVEVGDSAPAALWPPKGMPVIDGSDNEIAAVWPPPQVTVAVNGVDSTPAAVWPPKGTPIIDGKDSTPAAVWPPPQVTVAVNGVESTPAGTWPPTKDTSANEESDIGPVAVWPAPASKGAAVAAVAAQGGFEPAGPAAEGMQRSSSNGNGSSGNANSSNGSSSNGSSSNSSSNNGSSSNGSSSAYAGPKTTALQRLLTEKDEDGNTLTDEEVADNVLTLLFAGHDTSASALTCALHQLAMHPHIMEALRQEQKEVVASCGTAITPDALKRMRYTEAVVREVLRTTPIIAQTMRVAKKDFQLGEYLVPKGLQVMLGLNTIITQDKRWVQRTDAFASDKFNPERFLSEEGSKQGSQVPFGFGSRICLGMYLAMAEMKVFLAELARGYDFKADWNTPYLYFPMPRPSNNLPIIMTRWQ